MIPQSRRFFRDPNLIYRPEPLPKIYPELDEISNQFQVFQPIQHRIYLPNKEINVYGPISYYYFEYEQGCCHLLGDDYSLDPNFHFNEVQIEDYLYSLVHQKSKSHPGQFNFYIEYTSNDGGKFLDITRKFNEHLQFQKSPLNIKFLDAQSPGQIISIIPTLESRKYVADLFYIGNIQEELSKAVDLYLASPVNNKRCINKNRKNLIQEIHATIFIINNILINADNITHCMLALPEQCDTYLDNFANVFTKYNDTNVVSIYYDYQISRMRKHLISASQSKYVHSIAQQLRSCPNNIRENIIKFVTSNVKIKVKELQIIFTHIQKMWVNPNFGSNFKNELNQMMNFISSGMSRISPYFVVAYGLANFFSKPGTNVIYCGQSYIHLYRSFISQYVCPKKYQESYNPKRILSLSL